MPEEIINKFKDQYGDEKGEQIYYATANKQGRNTETFKKEESAMEKEPTLEELEKQLEEELSLIIASPDTAPIATDAPIGSEVVPPIAPSTSLVPPIDAPATSVLPTPSAGLPETVPGEVVPPAAAPIVPSEPLHNDPALTDVPPEDGPLMEKKDKKDEAAIKQVKGVGAGLDRKENKHMPPATKTEKDKTKYDRKDKSWKKFDESVNLYIAKTSRNCDIGVGTLDKMWKECIEEQSKGKLERSSRQFWLEVKSKFDKKVNDIFLQEAKTKMTERQKMSVAIESFLEHVATEKYVEAKPFFKEMVESCVKSMISERKSQYQKSLAEEIAKKLKEVK